MLDRGRRRLENQGQDLSTPEAMKAPREASNGWEKTLSRYFHAANIPLNWDYGSRRFVGLSGFDIARLNPKTEDLVWPRMPERFKSYEHRRTHTNSDIIVLVTNRQYGDSVDDSFVITRLGTFTPMLHALIATNPERYK